MCACVCPFDPFNFKPEWDQLSEMVDTLKPKAIIVTNPNNPSGSVFSESELCRLVSLCRGAGCWLVCDETYYEFTYDLARAICWPPSYDKLIHIFSLSKVFGMMGWRVGYLVFPRELVDSMRKLQDTIPVSKPD